MIRIKSIIAAFWLILAPAGIVVSSVYQVQAAPQDAICEGIGSAAGTSGCAERAEDTSINEALATVVNILSIILGIASVIMIIYGGFRYITSGGDASRVSSAKNTILYALIGLLVAFLAQAIVFFVIRRFQNGAPSAPYDPCVTRQPGEPC